MKLKQLIIEISEEFIMKEQDYIELLTTIG